MNWSQELLSRNARSGVMVASTINFLGMPLEILIGRSIPHMPNWPALISIAVGLIIFIYIFLKRDELSVIEASALYLINATIVTMALFVRDPFYAQFADHWLPFQAGKLACLIVALTAPTYLVGALGIGIHTLGSVLSFFMMPESVRERVSFGEPWPVVAFAVVGLLTLIYRIRQIRAERELNRTQVEVESMRNLAQAFVQLRDLMNTPLQTIEFSTRLLGDAATVEQKAILARVQSSLKDLDKINKILSLYESKVDWKQEPKFFDSNNLD